MIALLVGAAVVTLIVTASPRGADRLAELLLWGIIVPLNGAAAWAAWAGIAWLWGIPLPGWVGALLATAWCAWLVRAVRG